MRRLMVACLVLYASLPLLGLLGGDRSATVALLNVSNDPTRALWADLNRAFRARYEGEHPGERLAIRMSHGASGSQARAVIDGLDADVVSLALWPDTDALRRKGLIRPGWDRRPGASPYYSTIVFVVRADSDKNIRGWSDLTRPDVTIITPNPKTSGNGRLSFLAAWGAELLRTGSPVAAEAFVTQMYRRTPVLDTGARGASMTFAHKGLGDVHLTFESEAHLEVREAAGRLKLVYPVADLPGGPRPLSLLAEPPVAVVDATVDRKGTRAVAEEYVRFLETPEAQELFARNYYRPRDPAVLARHRELFPAVELFPLSVVAKDWDEAQARFFAEGGVFDRIYQPERR
jgi:sulfate/thiosulfate transport system substrate-binding protein